MVSIVGAGLVGSLWALLLQKRGMQVTLFEKRPDPRLQKVESGRSINLVVTSRGLFGLEKAGLISAIDELAVPVFGRMIHSKSGDQIYQAYGQNKECNYSISRGALNQFLISEAEKAGVKIYFEHEITELDSIHHRMTFTTPQGSKSYNFEIMFGADGGGSQVRKLLLQLFPQTKEKVDWLEADYKELILPLGTNGQPQLKTEALHIWPRGAHMMMALANRDGSFTATVYLPKKKTSGLSWSFEDLKTTKDIENFFRSEFPDAMALMPNYLSEFTKNPQGHLATVRCSPWVFADSIALIGDAAHAIVPFFGQGMNCGFEDCTDLLAILDSTNDWPTVLNKYQILRAANANAIADMALENWIEMRDKVSNSQFLFRKKVEATLEERFPGLYKSRYGLITYTLVPYALAQKAGVMQNEMLDRMIGEATSLDQINWPKAEMILREQWLPFKSEFQLEIKNYQKVPLPL